MDHIIAPAKGCSPFEYATSLPDSYRGSSSAAPCPHTENRQEGSRRKRRLSFGLEEQQEEGQSEARKKSRHSSGRSSNRFVWRGGRRLRRRSAAPSHHYSKMHIESLPTEIISHIFLSVSDVGSAINLSSTSHYLRDVYLKQRITILNQAADAEFGPVDDIIQVVTHNSSQPAHIGRSVPLSHALLQQIIRAGRVAQRWEHFYPFKKWKEDFENRRLLSNDERWLFRRAVYRLWLYSKAFHNREHSRTTRNLPELVIERSRLLHNWSSTELGEMLDVHNVMKQVIANNVCPSNGRIQQKFHKRYPESDHQLMFNMHVNYLQSSSNPIAILADHIPTKYNRLNSSRYHEPGAEGWGDDINHYYVVEDMMKLDPEQILFLCDRCLLKSQVEAYVRATLQGGEWFVNNGETFSETLAFVVKQRGGDPLALRQAVDEEEMGVTVHAI